jgi:Ca2+-binding RTX toxin-like protein
VSSIWGTSTLDGGAGDDTFKGVGHADTIIGGAGSDTVDFSHMSFVTVSLGDPLPYWAGLETVHGPFISIENLTGTNGQDVLVGNSGSNILRGLGGQDNLICGYGADVMYGGTDSDHYYVLDAGDVTWEYAGEGTFDVVWAGASYALPAGSEIEQLNVWDVAGGMAPINLTGNEFANNLNGGDGDNILNGGGGADHMYGGKGNDTYIVDNPGDILFENGEIYSTPEIESEGFDTVLTYVSYDVGLYNEIEVLQAIGTANVDLTGSLDNNRIIGNDGINVINGSYGKDTMTGGGAGDAFIWTAVEEIGWFNFDPDIVTDFNKAQDVLHFTNIDANETVAGNQDFTFIGTAAFTAPAQIGWTSNGTDTFILLNTNADLTVDGIIQLSGVPSGDGVLMFL